MAAEDLCELVHRDHGLPCLILRTSRFFPEADDPTTCASAYDDANLKVNELLYRRVDIEDVVDAHRLALERAPAIGFGRYIISATTPFTRDDLAELRARRAGRRARAVCPGYEADLRARGWAMFAEHRARLRQRARARRARLVAALRLRAARSSACERARIRAARSRAAVGAKGYHAVSTGPYTGAVIIERAAALRRSPGRGGSGRPDRPPP